MVTAAGPQPRWFSKWSLIAASFGRETKNPTPENDGDRPYLHNFLTLSRKLQPAFSTQQAWHLLQELELRRLVYNVRTNDVCII